MHARAGLLPLAAMVTVSGTVLLAGCSVGRAPTRQAVPAPAPALGAPTPAHRPPPRQPMNRLEKPVADRLARQIAHQGLTLNYLDCPPWDGDVPGRMVCRGYVGGLVARVQVRLSAAVDGEAVGFDAWLADGLIATQQLEETLHRRGWTTVDCGDVAAYPARVGTRIVCRVARGGHRSYVVATVSSPAGVVMIADYPGAGTDR